MNKIKDPEYVVFVKTGDMEIKQVLFTDDQRKALNATMRLICDTHLCLGPVTHLQKYIQPNSCDGHEIREWSDKDEL